MQTPSSHFLSGLLFSSVSLLFWGMLPIALLLSADFTDPITLTWLRFLVALVVTFIWQASRGKLNEYKTLTRTDWLRLLAAGSFLIVNYTTFAWSLNFLHPGAAQLNFQTAPLFLALGGLLLLKEKVRAVQWLCFAGLGAGMLLFFHPVFTSSGTTEVSFVGVVIVQVSASCWSIYALLQKSLFSKLSPTNILMAIYAFAAVVMFPFTHPSDLLAFNQMNIWIAAFCCINTLVAYGAFAQAMKYWQTVQVGAMISLTPVACFILTELCVSLALWPDQVHSAGLDQLSLIGIAMVVTFAITVQFVTAALQRRSQARLATESAG